MMNASSTLQYLKKPFFWKLGYLKLNKKAKIVSKRDWKWREAKFYEILMVDMSLFQILFVNSYLIKDMSYVKFVR